jgi:polysaccharide export outer membrane protein
MRKGLATVFFVISLAGCGAIPNSGPQSPHEGDTVTLDPTEQEESRADGPTLAVLNMDKGNVTEIDLAPAKPVAQWPGIGLPGNLKINVGDVLSITIYEEKAGGLFIPQEAGVRPGNFVSLPDQVVDASGAIIIPYVGAVRVVGKSPYEVTNDITGLLSNRAINPQVVVTYASRAGAEISVLGEVNVAQRHALSFDGERVLDAIAKAGGSRYPAYETYVTLQRDGADNTLLLDDIVLDPKKNIYLMPGDTVFLYKEASSYSVFGAVTRGGSIEFGRRKLLLSEALGKAFGLDSARADAKEIYVYRKIPKAQLLSSSSGLTSDRAKELDEFPNEVPLIMRFNLREADGYHLAKSFQIEDQDVIYVPDADTINIQKFIDVLFPTSATSVNVKTLD